MYFLGVNSVYHESAACLVRDGELCAAVEEERFTRRKHGKSATVGNPAELPVHAIRHCLDAAGIGPGDVSRIGYSLNPKLRLRNRDIGGAHVEGDWGSPSGEERFHRELMTVPDELRRIGLEAPLVWLDHHLCHAASSYLVSPFEEAAILCIDGIAEVASTMRARGSGGHIEPIDRIEYPASLGFLWERFCTFLGFSEYDACKVMGLASYGDRSRFRERMEGLVHLLPGSGFAVDNDVLRFRAPDDARLGAYLDMPARRKGSEIDRIHEDLAAALQDITDRTVVHLLRGLHEITGAQRLCLAGGVALNCVTNRVILEETPFSDVFIPPAPHDAGTAVGAALLLATSARAERRHVLPHPYLGPSFTDEEITRELSARGLSFRHSEQIEEEVADLLAAGRIVGWFQGAMEFGPRALGNRSLLADPRDPSIRDVMNLKVKHRELFRPFAPSVLAEHAAEWFVLPTTSSRPAELMLLAVPAQPDRRALIPGVVHIDGSSRVHTVRREQNPRYHALISAFHARTGVPLLLNTSFNDDEPIVCTPADAVTTFLKTRIDHLAIGDFLVERPSAPR